MTEESFVLENPVGDTYDEDLTYAGWEDEDPDYIFLAEGDLDEVMDEQDVMAALAAYQDTRQALKDQRLGRGYFPGKGKGKVNSFQKGKEKGKRRVHIEQLKLRTRCRRCQQIGHWERECKNAPVARTSSEPARTFFVGLQPGSESVEFSSESQQYWLRNFVKERKSHSRPATDSESEEAYMERACVCLEGSENFCGITAKSFEGIVDTAAEGGLVGRAPLARLEKELLMRGLRTKWTPKQTSAKGVGGNAVVEGVALIPLGIESIRGVLETTVVQGDVPLLLPVRLLVTLAAKIDLKNMIMELQNHQVEVPLHPLPSGHVTVNILSFAAGRFDVPREAGEQSEFEVNASCFMATAMPVQSDGHQFDLRPDAQIPPSSNGVAAPEGESTGGKPSYGGSNTDGSGAQGSQPKGTLETLAHHPGQDRHFAGFGGFARRHRGLVFGAGLAAAGTQLDGQYRGLLCGGNHACARAQTSAEQNWTDRFRQQLHSPEEPVEGWWQRFQFLHRVQSVPFQVGPFRTVSRCPQAAEARPLEHQTGQDRGVVAYQDQCLGCSPSDSSALGGMHAGRCHVWQPLDGRLDGTGQGGPPSGAEHSHADDPAAAQERAGSLHDPDVSVQRSATPADVRRAAQSHSGESRTGPPAREVDAVDHSATTSLAGALDPGEERSKSKLATIAPSDYQEDLSVREACGSPDREEGGTSERPRVLEVRPTQVRPFRMDQRAGPGGHRGGEDGGVIIEPEEVQEPEKGGLGVAGDEEKSSGGDDGGVGICAQHRLDEGELCREDAGGRCVGRRVRRLEEAPALTKCSGSKAVKWAKKAQAGEHVYLAAKPGYSTWREELWTHYESEIPEDIPEVYVEVYLNRRGLREEEWGEEKQRQLSRKERRELAKAIKSVEKKSQVILGEIYSPPRIALHLQKKGYQVGSSFDLQTGWDLSQDNHRRQMWRILREERPEVLVVSPPCTAFSRLQAINWGRMMPGHQVRLLQTGREHLQLASGSDEVAVEPRWSHPL